MFFGTLEQMLFSFFSLFAARVEDIHGKECVRLMENSATGMSEIEMSLLSEMGSKAPSVEGFQISGANRHVVEL